MAKRQLPPSTSPLAGGRYDRFRGECDLDAPVRLPLDDQIIALGRDFALRKPKDRKSFRRSLTEDDFYTLMCFGRRAAALALQTRDPRWLVEGLTACAMIETPRVDPRDVGDTPGLIFAVFHELGIDPSEALASAAAIAESRMSQIMLGFQDCPAKVRKLSAWLHEIVRTPDGLGLIRRDTCQYNPTLPLDLAILRIGHILRNDQYAAEITVATELPAVWLLQIDDQALSIALGHVIAGATVHADLMADSAAEGSWNGILVFLVETADENSAKALLRIASAKQAQLKSFAMMAIRRHRLFCLFTARNFLVGGRTFETDETLLRFMPATEQVLDEYATA